MTTTRKVNELTNVGDIQEGDVLVGERTNGTTVRITYASPLTDGDKGDITVASSGTVWTIDTPSVATVATDDKVLIKDTSASNVMAYVTAQSIANLAPPGGSNTQIQYNNAGSFGGVSQLTYNGTNVTDTTGLIIDGSTDEVQLTVQGHSTQTSNILEVQNSSATNVVTIDNSGNTYVAGTLSVTSTDVMTVNGATVASNVAIHGTPAIDEAHSHSDVAGIGAIRYFARSRGTEGASTIVQSGDTLGSIYAVGYDGTDYAISSVINFNVGTTPGANDMPGQIDLRVSPDGTQAPVSTLLLNHDLSATFAGSIAVAGTVDGRDVATDGTKLDGIEALADVTDAANIDTAIGGSNGLIARTASATFARRTITGTTNEITLTNGDGVSGNPTVSLPTNIDLSGKTTLKIPVGTAPTMSANGHLAIDTSETDWSHGILQYYSGEKLGVMAMPYANFSGMTDGQMFKYDATNDEIVLGPNYLTGTWTPSVTCATPGDLSVSYGSRTGTYIKVGTLVTIFCDITFSPTYTTASGTFRIATLPYTANDSNGNCIIRFFSSNLTWGTGKTVLCAVSQASATYLILQGSANGTATAQLTISDFVASGASNARVIFCGQYTSTT